MKKVISLVLAAALVLPGCAQRQPDENSLEARPSTRPAGEVNTAVSSEVRHTIKSQGKLTDGSDYIIYTNNALEINTQALTTSLKTEKALAEDLKNITMLTLNAVTVGDGSCSDLTVVQEVYFGEAVEVIGSNAFSKCTALNRVTFSTGLRELGDYAFQGCSSLWGADLPEGITSMGRSLFADCKSMRSVKIASSVGEDSFANCTSLEDITFQETCKIIGKRSFSGCTGIKNLVLGKGLERIEDRAFSGCENIEYLYLPGTIQYVGHLVFLNDNRIKDVECESYTSWYRAKREEDALKDSMFYNAPLRETKK